MNRLSYKRPILVAAFLLAFACSGWMSDTIAQDAEMSVLFNRTCQINPGKTTEALQWAKDMNVYIAGKFPDRNARVYTQAFGPLGKVNWFSSHKDMAALDDFWKSLSNDSGYQERIGKATGLFGGCEDKLFMAIP
jgi:hypothetical protein